MQGAAEARWKRGWKPAETLCAPWFSRIDFPPGAPYSGRMPHQSPHLFGRFLPALAAFLLTSALHAQTEPEVTALLKRLQSADADERREAVAGLQTSLDPRIPDACLAALEKDGESVRRLAARAIGSRWQQIPKERIPVFTAALKAHLKSEHDGLVNMARRGIALLTRDYTGKMLSRSKSRRWVIYERYGLPCLIDTTTSTEELLGFGTDGNLTCAWGNTELAPSALWHPRKDMVALDILYGRKSTAVWVWTHGKGLRRLDSDEILKTLGQNPGRLAAAAGFFVSDIAWAGDSLTFSLSYAMVKGDDFIEHDARLRWDPAKDKLTAVSDKITR
jgi:hypothetical protein